VLKGNDLRSHRRRLYLFPLAAIAIFAGMYVLYSAIATLHQLDVIESERDRWQRPSDVLGALNLHDGDVVADLGSGAGYFTLKLSPIVRARGKVLAIDLRKLSLSFLWAREVLRSPHNIHIIVGEPDDPHLPVDAVDAVLIVNAYHEFNHPDRMLDHVFRSLRAGGRLVMVDRGSERATGHAIGLDAVLEAVQMHGFQIQRRDAKFIGRAEDVWWLVAASKPVAP
jgi:ubiquinone/menaquinone biosynthesis C-methylase UbiE